MILYIKDSWGTFLEVDDAKNNSFVRFGGRRSFEPRTGYPWFELPSTSETAIQEDLSGSKDTYDKLR
jgi:hypothetical protein